MTILTPQQINTMMELLNKQLVFFAGNTLGTYVLSDSEKQILKDHKIDVNNIYDPKNDIIANNFLLGMLSEILGQQRTKNMTYQELMKYVGSGQHIALNAQEKATIDNLKMQSLSDIRSANGKIFSDVNNVVTKASNDIKADQQKFIQQTIIEGTSKRQSIKEIVRELGRLTGDWSRNFTKSVAYISHTALNEGRAAMMQRKAGDGKQAKVYFQVQKDACPSCIKSYLSNGPESEPKIFTLDELYRNGNNIGRKQKEWLPTLSALHPHCRCLASEYIDGQVWKVDRFVWPEKQVSQTVHNRVNRPKIRIVFNGEEHWV